MADLKTTNIYGDAYINNKVGINTNTPATRLQIGQLSPTAATEGLQFGDDTSARLHRINSGHIRATGGISSATFLIADNYLQTNNNLIYPSSQAATQRLEVGNSANNAWIDGITIAPGGNVNVYNNLSSVNGYVYAGTYLQSGNSTIYAAGYGNTLVLNVGNASGNNWINGIAIAQGGNVTVYNNLTVNNNATVTNDLTVNGNTYLGNANNDTVYVNDTIRIGATDSGDASLFFGEGTVAGSDYGARWYWDSGYTFYWYTRNNGTDTALFDYVTNDTTYLNWRRHFHMQNKEINYNAQVHFNAGTRFVGQDTNYLIFKSDATNAGGFKIQDGSGTTKGYTGYWDSAGGGILNNGGNWAVRYNFGGSNSGGTLYGDWTVNGNSTVTGITMTNLTGAYQNTTVYDSPRTQSATPSRGIRAPASSIQFTDSYAIAPYYTYRSTGDWPVPYGIGWGTGGESSGIFQRYASNGSSFGDMIFYTGNDGSGAFSFRRHTWEGTTYFAAGSGELNTELFRIDWSGNLTMLGTLNGSANSATLYANNGSYGSWKIGGTRNSWYGIEFESGTCLMANGSESGFYRVSSGWQMRWYAGNGYIYKGNPGGGTEATILDSSNQSYAWAMNQNVTTTSNPTFGTLQLTRLNFGATGAAPYAAASGEGYGNGITFGGDENSAAYRIFTGMENIGGNYSKLTFNWHTGIRMGAYYGYGGIRFYDNYVGTGNKVFSIAESDSNVRVYNELIVQGSGINGAYGFMKYGGTRSGDWQLFTTSSAGAGQMNVVQVENIGGGGHTNYPTGVYTYGGVMSWRLPNHSFQLYAAHTGDLAYKTQWNNDNYSGWRRILDSTNYPYAANMNQYVRTTDTCSFASLTVSNTINGSVSGNSGNVSISNLNTQQVSVGLTAGSWYTIAANAGDRASAKFTITDGTSGLHQAVHFYASAHFGTATGAKITVVSNTYYGGPPFGNIRIMTGGTYDGAMVQVYINTNCTINVSIYDNQQVGGWIIKSGVVSTTNPGTVAAFASLTTTSAQVDLNSGKSFSVTDDIYIGGTTTQYKALHANNYNSYAAALNGATNQNFSAYAIYPYEWIRFKADNGIYWETGTYSGHHIYPQTAWGMSFRAKSTTDCGLQLRKQDNTVLGSVYSDGTSIGFLDASNGWGASFTLAGTMNRGTVPLARIETITAYTILGNNNASAAAVPSALSVATVATMLSGQTMNIAGSSTSCTGNAATATTLQTARNIGGVSFNGSADINLPGVNTAGNQNTSGNAATATNLSTTRSNWSTNGTITAVVGQLSWKNYGNGHTIFDASAATSPATGAISNTNPDYAWTATYPTLMGWNGANTYGVRVDSSRYSDQAATAVVNSGNTSAGWYPIVWHSGNTLYSTANVLLWAQNGYIQANYFNSSDDVSSGNISYIMAKFGDGYLRSATAAKVAAFISNQTMSIQGSSTSCSGNAATVTNGVYTTGAQSISGVKTFSDPPVAVNIAKAWVHFNGTGTVAINTSYNVSSITDNGVGDYTVNFTSAFVDANYVVAGTSNLDYTNNSSNYNVYLSVPRQTNAQQAGSCRLATEYPAGVGLYDCVAVRAVFFR